MEILEVAVTIAHTPQLDKQIMVQVVTIMEVLVKAVQVRI